MIKALIENYGEVGYAGIIIIAMIWYFYYQTKSQTKRDDKHDAIQKEERLFYRTLVTNDMKSLHDDSLKNADLNNQTIILQKDSIILQKELTKDLKSHNENSKEAWGKTIESLGIIADRLNGGSPASMKIKKELELYKQRGIIDRRKVNKKVEVERRA